MSEGLVYKKLEEIEQQVRLKIPIEHCEDILELIDDVRILVEAKDIELKRREGETQPDTESKCHIQNVNRWAYVFDNWQPIMLGIAMALAFNVIVAMFENVIVKIALIINGG